MLLQIPTAILFVLSTRPAACAADASPIADARRPVRVAAAKASPGSASIQQFVRDQVTDGLERIAHRDASFFEQLELSIARNAFGRAKAGAVQMVDPDGTVHPSLVDTFHDFIDEFLRALAQFESNDVPRDAHFGKAAISAAEHLPRSMERKELRATAKRLFAEITALKQKANDTPGLRDLEREDTAGLDLPSFVARVQRTIVRVEVITGHCGLGPVFTPAIAEAEPLRRSLLRLAQAANALDSGDDCPTPAQAKAVEEWLDFALDNARNLGKNAPAWRSASNGSRGALAVRALEGLRRTLELAKAKWLPR